MKDQEDQSALHDNFTDRIAGLAKEQRIWSIAYSIFGLLIFVLNFASILTFVLNRHLCRRSAYSLINLAVADMMYGGCRLLFALSYIGIYRMNFTLSPEVYDGLTIVTSLSFIAAGFCLILVPLERVYAISFPFRHRTLRTRTYLITFATTWFLSLLLPILRHIHKHNHLIQFVYRLYFIIGFALLVLVSISYLVMFLKVKTQNDQHQQHQQQAAIQRKQQRERHLGKTLFLVTLLSLISWLPYLVFDFIQSLTGFGYFVSSDIVCSIYLIQFSNSLINPFIYVLRMNRFRSALFRLVFRCSRNRTQIRPVVVQGDRPRRNDRVLEVV